MAANRLRLCWRAIGIASSSVMLVGLVLCPNAGLASAYASIAVTTTLEPIFWSSATLFKGSLGFRKLVAVFRNPDVKRR